MSAFSQKSKPSPSHSFSKDGAKDAFFGIQAKLTIGKSNDKYEAEADAVADHVVSSPHTAANDAFFNPSPGLLRQSAGQNTGEAQKGVQKKPQSERTTPAIRPIAVTPVLKKNRDPEKQEEKIACKEEDQKLRMSSSGDAGPGDGGHLENTLKSTKGGGSPLPANTKAEMESGIGADFSNVRVHNDANAAGMNKRLGAQAFATGNDIYFNEGKFNPSSQSGKHLLAHELAHTVQQGAAVRMKPDLSAAPEMIQASFLSELIPDFIKGNVRHIPGYTLLTVIAGYDPLNDRNVPLTATNLLEGLMGLVPFGTAIFDKLQQYGIIDRAFDWIRGRLSELNLTMDGLLDTIQKAWDEASLTDFIDVATDKFNDILNRITAFAGSLVGQLIAWVKEALVGVAEPLLAQNKAWALIKKIIRYDPLRDEQVNATTVEILADFLILIGKQTELDQMREKGTLQKTADWLDTQIGTFNSLLGELRALITAAWDAVQPSNLANITDSLTVLAAQAGGLLQRVWDFASGIALKVLELVKESLLGWLSSHASGVRGYSLIKVIIGKDPFTNEIVPRSATNIIRGFMSLMDGGEQQYAQMAESGAIARIIGQIEAAVATLNMTPEYIIQLFTDLWNSFTIDDLIHPLDAFTRIIEKFGEPIGRLIAFVAEIIRIVIVAIMEMMNFPFDLIGNIISRAMQAIEDIKKDPIGFLKNILRAIKQGFSQFFSNIVSHLVRGVTGWLMSELRDANVPVLTDFSLRGVISWVLQVLNISMERIWEKLAAHPRIGPARVARIRSMVNTLEGIWTFIKDVQQRGIAAIWDKIQEQLSNLWNTVLDTVKNFVMERIVNRITARLLSMLDPTGIMAVINAAMALYNAIESFIRYFREMLAIVNSFVNGVADIARGNVATAANYLERTMGQAMPVVIGFLANQVGLTGIGRRIAEIIASVRDMVDRALTWLVNKAVDTGMALLDRVMAMGARARDAVLGWLGLRREFTLANGERHTISIQGTENAPTIIIASDPKSVEVLVAERRALVNDPTKPSRLSEAQDANLDLALRRKATLVAEIIRRRGLPNYNEAELRTYIGGELDIIKKFLKDGDAIPTEEIPLTNVTYEMKNGKSYRITASPLTKFGGNTSGSGADGNPKGWNIATYLNTNARRAATNVANGEGGTIPWKQVHLLSARLHGPGGEDWNLTVSSEEANGGMRKLEIPTIKEVSDGKIYDKYEIIVTYPTGTNPIAPPVGVVGTWDPNDFPTSIRAIVKKRGESEKTIPIAGGLKHPPLSSAQQTVDYFERFKTAIDREFALKDKADRKDWSTFSRSLHLDDNIPDKAVRKPIAKRLIKYYNENLNS